MLKNPEQFGFSVRKVEGTANVSFEAKKLGLAEVYT
jgi:hypothetical protein